MGLLKNCRLATNDQLRDLRFEKNIERIGADLEERGGETVYDCEGKLLFPGFIDSHVHFRDFEEKDKEDWHSGGRAAVKGGVTTVIDMPNNSPPILTSSLLEQKRKKARQSPVDFKLFCGISNSNLDQLSQLAEEEDVVGFKLYMSQSTGDLALEEGQHERVFSTLGRERGEEGEKESPVLVVHAEDPEINQAYGERPAASETLAVAKAVKLAFRHNVKLHIAHVSTKGAVEVIRNAKRIGVDVTAEATPHHLLLNQQQAGELATMNPPLRDEEDRKAVWQALKNGTIDIVSSDHAPHSLEDKRAGSKGVPGVEYLVPLLLNQALKDNISLARVTSALTQQPAQRFGLNDRGSLETNKRADLVIVDSNKEKTISREDHNSKCGWSPYEDMTLRGWPQEVFINGQKVAETG